MSEAKPPKHVRNEAVPPAPDCAMCGHAAHERDCETKVLREQIPCGCQFWAEGWKLTAPPAPERMSDEEFDALVMHAHGTGDIDDPDNPRSVAFTILAEARRARESEAAHEAGETLDAEILQVHKAALAAKEAEITALKGDRDDLLKDWSVLAQRNADLLARAEKAEAALAAKEADLEACRANNRNATRMLNAKDAEVERLRAALEGWDAYGWKDGVYVDDLDAYFKSVIAREALEGKP